MSITEKELDHIAELARIKLSDQERGKFAHDLASIIDYINKLKEADTESLEPMLQVSSLVNRTRHDRTCPEPINAAPEALVKAAPQSENGFVKVKAALKKK